MKLATYLLIILLATLGCNQEQSSQERPESSTTNDSENLNVQKNNAMDNEPMQKIEPPFFIINTAAVTSEDAAIRKAQALEKEGYLADYLWIPDYPSLSGAEFYSVYIGPYKTKTECAIVLDKYHAVAPKAYGTLVSYEPGRVVVNGLDDAVQ